MATPTCCRASRSSAHAIWSVASRISFRRARPESADISDAGQHRLDFRYRRARLGAVELNALQFGGEVMVVAPDVPDFYLLQFMLAGSCTLTQGGRSYDMPAGSVAVINSSRPFTKKWSSCRPPAA